jgi:SAM-dependent methyltransferase
MTHSTSFDVGAMNDSPYSRPDMTAIYDRIAAPFQFSMPAQDLVSFVVPRYVDSVLDVGTGTGVVAAAAKKVVQPAGTVVGTDAAIEMLRLGRKKTANLAVARVPGLPFPAECFDAVVAGFVLSHFENYVDGLVDMIRVCRTGGRVGVSAWGSLPNPANVLWSDIAGHYFSRDQLDEAFRRHIPWDTWFSQIENVVQALRTSGLSSVITETRYYTVRMPTSEFLASREASMQGLLLRQALSSAKWNDFTIHISEAFREKFGETVEYRRDAHFGVGTKIGENSQ